MRLQKKSALIFLKLFVCLLFTQIGFAQFTIPEKPTSQTSVYDYANILSATEKAQLEEKLIKYSDSTTTQIVVITIESLKFFEFPMYLFYKDGNLILPISARSTAREASAAKSTTETASAKSTTRGTAATVSSKAA